MKVPKGSRIKVAKPERNDEYDETKISSFI